MEKSTVFKSNDVTRPSIMVKSLGFRGTFSVKFKIDFLNNLMTASVLVENHAVLQEIQQLGYLSSNLMLRCDSPVNNIIVLRLRSVRPGPNNFGSCLVLCPLYLFQLHTIHIPPCLLSSKARLYENISQVTII